MKSLCGYCGLMFICLLSLSNQTQPPLQEPVAQGTDCTQIKALSPTATSGVYLIQPGVCAPFHVYCKMLSDGGWTVFQRRTGGALSFERKWAEYKHGFGNLEGDHWLGLKRVFSLTKNRGKTWTMKVDLFDHEGGSAFAEYSDFRLGSENEAFKLSVGAYKGDAGDAILGTHAGLDQNGFGFSTTDRDNDGCKPCLSDDLAWYDCSRRQGGGGWWFSRCGSANLHGPWRPAGEHLTWTSGLLWHTWKGWKYGMYSASATRMMIKSTG